MIFSLQFRKGKDFDPGWNGRTILLVDEEIPSADIKKALVEEGIHEILDISNQPVEISDFTAMESTTLKACLERLIPLDPRLDPFILGMTRYFKYQTDKKIRSVFYLNDSNYAKIELAMSKWKNQYAIYKSFPPVTTLFWCLPLIYSFLILFSLKPFKLYRLFFVFPWMPFWFSEDVFLILIGIFGMQTFFILEKEIPGIVRPYALIKFKKLILEILPKLILGIISFSISGKGILLILNAIAGSIVVFIISKNLKFLDYGIKNDIFHNHTLFKVTTILKQNKPDIFSLIAFKIFPYFIAVILLFTYQSNIKFRQSNESIKGFSAKIPLPVDWIELPQNAEEVLLLITNGPKERLPDLSDYIVHKAYQESLSLGRLGMVDYGIISNVSMPEFGSEKMSNAMKEKILLDFDTDWIKKTIIEASKSGIIGLGIQNDKFSRVSVEPASPFYLPTRLEARRFLVYIFLLFSFISTMLNENIFILLGKPKIICIR